MATADWQEAILAKVAGIPVPYSATFRLTGTMARYAAGVVNHQEISVRTWMQRQVAMHVSKLTGIPFLDVVRSMPLDDECIGLSGWDCPHPGCDGRHLLD